MATAKSGAHFNPLSPHGERLLILALDVMAQLFQSTLPAWGETIIHHVPRRCLQISIHSPRMGRDVLDTMARVMEVYFNPLSPHGERPVIIRASHGAHGFQSTLPAWGETFFAVFPARKTRFQSTLPAWGETAFSA